MQVLARDERQRPHRVDVDFIELVRHVGRIPGNEQVLDLLRHRGRFQKHAPLVFLAARIQLSLIWIDLCHELASDSRPERLRLGDVSRDGRAFEGLGHQQEDVLERVDPAFRGERPQPEEDVESIGFLLQFLAQLLDFRTLLVAGVWFGGVEGSAAK